MIREFKANEQDNVDAIPDPKHVWWDITRIVVYTGTDMPVPPPPEQGAS